MNNTMYKAQPVRSINIPLGISVILLISFILAGCGATADTVAVADTISIEEAYEKYNQGVFFLDVRTQGEWDEYHAPNTTLIPLDQLESRLGELPQGEEIVVVCRSGNRSQAGRDILRQNGFEQATSMDGGLSQWRAAGYPIE